MSAEGLVAVVLLLIGVIYCCYQLINIINESIQFRQTMQEIEKKKEAEREQRMKKMDDEERASRRMLDSEDELLKKKLLDSEDELLNNTLKENIKFLIKARYAESLLIKENESLSSFYQSKLLDFYRNEVHKEQPFVKGYLGLDDDDISYLNLGYFSHDIQKDVHRFEHVNEDLSNLAQHIDKLIISYREEYMKVSNEEKELICTKVEEYYDKLCVKHNQLVYEDDYGETIIDNWMSEIGYFLYHIVFPNSDLYEGYMEGYMGEKLLNMTIVAATHFYDITKIKIENNEIMSDVDITSGVDYENYVESLLVADNFKVSRTPTSGDQGVDLIAEKHNKRIAIQCKYYSKPVGNKAVQEVIAGQKFYNCGYACVVSNNSYTKSAQKIANVSNVLLLNDINIVSKLNNLIGE